MVKRYVTMFLEVRTLQITIRLFASLRTNRFKEEKREYPQGATIADVAEDLGIAKEELALTLVKGHSVSVDYELNNNDTLSIFPPSGGG